MLSLSKGIEVHLSLSPVDMRKSIDEFSGLVVDQFGPSLQSGSLFVFGTRARDKVKILCWDKNGFLMHCKRIEKARFKLANLERGGSITLSNDQLQWLLAGLNFNVMHEFSYLNYENYY